MATSSSKEWAKAKLVATLAPALAPSPDNRACVGDLVVSSVDDLPFELPAEELLASVAKRMKVPRCEGYRSFKPTLKSPSSRAILTYYFWSLYCRRFTPQDRKNARKILDRLAEHFVTLFWALKAGAVKDYFLKYFPFAIAAAVNAALYEQFDGSRELFTDDFQNSVYQDSVQVFSGVNSTLDAMQQKRDQLALSVSIDKSAPRGETGEQQQSEGPIDHFSDWTEEEMQAELQKIPGYVEHKVQRLKRVPVDALSISPLVKHYVKAIAETNRGGQAKGATLKRTITDPHCQFGGEETFVRTTSRVDDQEEMHKKWVEKKAEQKHTLQYLRRSLRQDLQLLDQAKTSLLKQGNSGKAVSQFVEDLVEQKLNH
mmetsp:Transcript_30644/g.66890  ORF Transcript_30644/g.66890 Transcript_30644/m.66890 type:complete len:371 (-) Transcript_30644:8-1120(-)